MSDVLMTAPYMLPFLDRFQPVFKHFTINLITPVVRERLEESDLLKYAGKFDGTICGDDRYTRKVLETCSPRLKVIAKWGTGTDSIDRMACEDLGIQLLNTPNAFTLPVADSVLGYILAFARQQVWMDKAVKTGVWKKIPGRSLSECTLGVIGVGNIGKAVLRRARGFGMTLFGTDIQPIPRDFLLENQVKNVSLQQLLEQSDFVSVNCDLNPTSYHLINKSTLGYIKPTSVLINTARGPIVEENALVEALQAGQISGAALDVFEQEPIPASSPLLKMENVLLAPHNSNSSPAAWENVHWNTIHNLLQGLGIKPDDLSKWQQSA
ncbi:MAG: D-3-phosphoglycerate dehydrogenase [Chloroflexi bacterium]|nr:MAG: D-3-phosphoglycerate dehydrogenase [Chloroflexota bacterium]MBA4375102.1 dihydrofolate reductase [Anaerolinea sp.]